MNQLVEWLSRLFGSWKFWVIVPPWDVGVRVRMGKGAAVLAPGPHWRIPFLDEVTLVNTRLRIEQTASVTIDSERPMLARVRSALVTYRISDPGKAMLAYTNAAPALLGATQGRIADGADERECLERLRETFGPRGIDVEEVHYVERVTVLAIRLLNATWSVSSSVSIPAKPDSSVGAY